MSEELHQRIKELENRNKVLTTATEQWEQLQKMFLDSQATLKKNEHDLREINERMERALNAGDLAWWDWEYKTGAIYYNPERARLLGYSVEELPRNFSDVVNRIHPDDHDETVALIRKHIAGETEYYEAEYRLQSKSGEWKWFYDRGKVVERDIMGDPVLISGVLIDINERKVAERELTEAHNRADAASKAKSLFLANMSHEIYTPLAGVVGMADILKQSELADEQREYIDIIVNSASNLLSVLNDIMEYIKVENKKVELSITPVNIPQLIQEISTSIRERCREKGLEVLLYIDTQIPDHVMGDPKRVRQLLQIFVNNAVKFTEQGRIILAAEFAGWDDDSIRVRFRITDTGIGIPQHEIGRLFDSFTRVNTKIGKYGGSGLGLAIAKHLVDLMNGVITVESEEGKGSTFTCTVEFDRLVEQETHLDASGLAGRRILLVDSDTERRTLLNDYFLVWDCETEERNSLQEAQDALLHQFGAGKPFDLILIEAGTWSKEDHETVNQLNEASWYRAKPVLIAPQKTDFSTNGFKREGFRTLLFRPFLPEQLLEALKSALSGETSSFNLIGDAQFADLQRTEKRVLKILLAEDNLINQRVALVTLKKLGHETDLAENGVMAVEQYEPGKYDLILMDILMPEMNGLDAARKIREMESETNSEPVHICAITANIHKEDEEACYEAGMNSYITKPFRLEELNKVLSAL
ncbi:MAG: response regulator [Bacteroidetes bacterium]|nr:MAG: response regulator [Bacteroidota bacterium]